MAVPMLIWALVRSTGPRVVVVKVHGGRASPVHRTFYCCVMFWILYDGANGSGAGVFTMLVLLVFLRLKIQPICNYEPFSDVLVRVCQLLREIGK